MLKIYLILIVSFGLVMASSHVLSGEFSVSPLIINIAGEKNKYIPFEFTIKAKKTGKVALKVFDLKQIETGHMGFIEGSVNNKKSKVHWLSLKESEYAIKTGEFRIVKGMVKVPRKMKGQHLAAIMVEEMQSNENRKGIKVHVRYAVILKIDMQGGRKKKMRSRTKFTEVASNKIKNGWEIGGFFKNLSKVEGSLVSELQLRDKNKRLVARIPLKTLSAWQRNEGHSMVYPDSNVKIFGLVPDNVISGEYNIRIKHKFNGRSQAIYRGKIKLVDEVLVDEVLVSANQSL